MKWVPLGEFMVTRGGTVTPSAYPDERFDLFSIPAHDADGFEEVAGADVGSAKQSVQPGDVMISKIVPHIRRARVVSEFRGHRQIASGEWIVFRGERFDSDFLRHYLLSDQFHHQFMSTVAGVGGSLLRARPAQVKAIPVPLPDLDEQRRVAVILDHADALRAQRHEALAHVDDLARSIFHDMFGSMTRTPRWPVRPLGELANSRLGKMLDAKQQTGKHLRPYLRNANVQWFRFRLDDLVTMDFDEQDRVVFALRSGDVLICEGGQPGRCAVWTGELEECYFQKALHRVRLGRELIPEYFVHALKSIVEEGGLKDYVTSATIAHLTGEKLRTLPIPTPNLEAQHKFAERLEQLQATSQAITQAAEADELLFASLRWRAFRGDL